MEVVEKIKKQYVPQNCYYSKQMFKKRIKHYRKQENGYHCISQKDKIFNTGQQYFSF